MARQILFRGKDSRSGEWVFGSLILFEDEAFISPQDGDKFGMTQVDFASTGQFTGLQIQGKNVFEGDIIAITPYDRKPSLFEVFWSTAHMAFRVKNTLLPGSDGWGYLSRLVDLITDFPGPLPEIVGNRFDNPTLMEKGNG